jgi:hypothetical protein
MKKLFAFAAIVAAVSFSSCGNKSAESTEAVAEQPAVEEVVPAVDNLAKCYYNEAKRLKDSMAGSKQRLRKTDENKERELLQNARIWITKASLLDPKQDMVEWKQMLDYINKVIR